MKKFFSIIMILILYFFIFTVKAKTFTVIANDYNLNLSNFNSKQHFDFSLPENFKYEIRKKIIEFRTSNGSLFYSNTIEYPYFFGKSLVEQKINQKYEQMILDYKNATIDFDTEWDGQLPFYDDVRANVIYNKNGAISIKEILSVWSGGAHIYHYINGITYDNLTGKELSYNDILIGSDEQIDKVLTVALCKALGYTPCKSQLNALKEYTTYSLCEYGLCFYYNVGDAIPKKEVIIPFTDKNSYIISANDICIDI